MNGKTFLLGLTAGLIGGAAAVLFSTPQSGAQLRQNITTNTNAAKSKFQDIQHEANHVKESIVTLKNEAQNNMPNIINELKDNFTAFKSQIEPETTILKQEIENLQNSIKEIEKKIPQSTKKEQ